MDTKKYFAELSRILGRNEIQTAPPERNTLPILLCAHSACRVGPSGELCKFPGDLESPEASDLYFKAAPIATKVKEYMTAMEKSLLLKAVALDEEFRLLAVFNGAVLAGRKTQHGYKFVTWERDYNFYCSAEQMAANIKFVGANKIFLATDRGQVGYESPVEGYIQFIKVLHNQGISTEDLITMTQRVPSELLSN